MYRPLFHLSSFLQHVLRVACDADAAVMICEPPHTFDELPQQARHCVRAGAQGGGGRIAGSLRPRVAGHLAVLPIAILATSLYLQAAPAYAEGQCLAGETTYFSCKTSQGNVMSLCGNVPSALQYRYGRPPHVELAYPLHPANGTKKLLFAHYSRYQVSRSEVTFGHAGNDYAVFDYLAHGQRHAGLHLTLPDGSEHEVHCTGPISGRLNALRGSLHCDPDSALNGGSCP
ncbi:MAG: hypothetical protein KGK04_11900 [Xanthomonadaceae bacterium]|nr:hypothetical protein [Xanthomonadaceae bacterium]